MPPLTGAPRPLRRGDTGPLVSALRDVLRRAPTGPTWFPHVAHLFTLAANNAIVGARPGHPLLRKVLDGMLDMPPERQLRRYALGTHLLQRVVREAHTSDLVVHPQSVFYPLGPELSEHWFRVQRRTHVDDVVAPETRAVHWYASVRTRRWVARMDADFVRQHRDKQLLSGLLAPYAQAQT